MLQDYFESFALLEKQASPDGMGGEHIQWRYVTHFRGGLTHTAGKEIDAGGRATLLSDPVLLHDMEVTLSPGDCIRRERDNTLWRVKGCSADMRSPAFSGLGFAQVQVERLVIPC